MYFHVHVWLHGHCSCLCMHGRGRAGCSAFAWAGPDLDLGRVAFAWARPDLAQAASQCGDPTRERGCAEVFSSLLLPPRTPGAPSPAQLSSSTLQQTTTTRLRFLLWVPVRVRYRRWVSFHWVVFTLIAASFANQKGSLRTCGKLVRDTTFDENLTSQLACSLSPALFFMVLWPCAAG